MFKYKGKSKKFRDAIHGYIEIPDIIVSEIIDTETFQRLKCIEQTSMRSLYPAARHDRFIHSLGVYWLGRQVFGYFRSNARQVMAGTNQEEFADKWWNKQELLFELACLLHDCAHAPFSHTLETLYTLRRKQIKAKNPYGLKAGTVLELDLKLAEKCKCEDAFSRDFWTESEKDLIAKGVGNPHEKMSSYCVISEYSSAVRKICGELLGEVEITDQDLVFIVRMIIGCTYTEPNVENSIRNCIISMLNSSSVDVDGLDYVVRDAYMSGIDNYSIDYQRLLSSFTVIPVEAFDEQRVDGNKLDGIWLKDTEFEIESLEADCIRGKLCIDDLIDKMETANIDGLGCNISKIDRSCSTKSGDRIIIKRIQSGKMLFEETCIVEKSLFSGTIKNGRRIVSNWHPRVEQNSRQEYILGYDKNSLSVIQSTVEARNHEYLWVYTHPKVLYASNYLQNQLMQDAARYLCCYVNKKDFDKEKLTFDCDVCVKKPGNKIQDTREDFLLYIMGYTTYFDGEKDINHSLKKKSVEKLVKKGYVFYRTCDDDLNALFKRIHVENEMRGKLKSDSLSADLKEYFSRQHKKPLWKSFVEYDNFLKMCDEDAEARGAIQRFCEYTVPESSTNKKFYDTPSPEQEEVFREYGLKDVVVIRSSVKTKALNPGETFIKFKEQVFCLNDLFDSESTKGKLQKKFYYIFANVTEKNLPRIMYFWQKS